MKWDRLAARLAFSSIILLSLLLPCRAVSAQEKTTVPAGGTVNIAVTAGTVSAPAVSLTLLERQARVTPTRGHCTHTGGGLIDVASPAADTIVISMTGVVVANSDMTFELDQSFEVNFDDPKVKRAKLTLEGRVLGLLRGEPKGSADYSDACAHIGVGPVTVLSLCVPPHGASGHVSQSVNDHDGPRAVPVGSGRYMLHQTFAISAHSDSILHKRPSAEFAPDPALDPLWITYLDPFHGVNKKDFGFQVFLKVSPDRGD
jgi:hypothetical protein